MIILVWIISVISMIMVFGELRYRYIKNDKGNNKIFQSSTEWTDSIDKDIDSLSIEMPESIMIPTASIAKRGSWRLAQDMVMGVQEFVEMKEAEYCKYL